jgi:hypothetical protein
VARRKRSAGDKTSSSIPKDKGIRSPSSTDEQRTLNPQVDGSPIESTIERTEELLAKLLKVPKDEATSN